MNRALTLASLGDGYRALVIGASGALGTAFCERLKQDPHCAGVRALGRRTLPALDLERPETIASAALANFRTRHEAFRTLLCHGTVKVSVERNGNWVLVLRTLSIRGRQADRATEVLEQSAAQVRLADLKRDGQKLAAALGQIRKTLTTT